MNSRSRETRNSRNELSPSKRKDNTALHLTSEDDSEKERENNENATLF